MISSIRTHSDRKKPRVRETIVPIVTYLRDGNAHRFKDIFSHVTAELKRRGMEPRRIATGFALTWLAREDFVTNIRHGFWQVTAKGLKEDMTPEIADQIEQRHDPAFHQQKVLKHLR